MLILPHSPTPRCTWLETPLVERPHLLSVMVSVSLTHCGSQQPSTVRAAIMLMHWRSIVLVLLLFCRLSQAARGMLILGWHQSCSCSLVFVLVDRCASCCPHARCPWCLPPFVPVVGQARCLVGGRPRHRSCTWSVIPTALHAHWVLRWVLVMAAALCDCWPSCLQFFVCWSASSLAIVHAVGRAHCRLWL